MPHQSRITIHARKARTTSLGITYVGYIAVHDGPSRWTESTQIHRLTRADALADAEFERQDLVSRSSHA
jgi:hypothetical protein